MGNCTSRNSSHKLSSEISKTPLFINTVYRIPALIYINDTQTFLAFAEKRTSSADVDATFLVMRRGTQLNGAIQWEDITELRTACLDGYRSMNPCPVYEKHSKTVFLFFNSVFGKVTEPEQIRTRKNRAKLCYVTSKDSGRTWSGSVDLTERVIGDEIKNWATFSVGPGHGIQMNNGRLIIPAYAYYIGLFCVNPHAFAFYSDDRGRTWKFGQRVSVESSECEMAEVKSKDNDGYLYCNARSTNGYRVEALSQKDGVDCDTILVPKKLVEPPQGCQGSVVSFAHDNKTCLLFSHPTDSKERKNLGVYLNKSPFHPSNWKKPHIINSGVSGYSDLAQCRDDHFACLMERGTSTLEEIAFAEFSLSDIMKRQ